MAKLGVNIDHVATIREARKINYPDPILAARVCEDAGADSIVCHLREDRRHIQDGDLFELRKKSKIKVNLEMAMSREIVEIAIRAKPDQVTLVPEKRRELTTEGGLDVVKQKNKIKSTIDKFKKNGIDVSLFVDPEKKQVKSSKEAGASMIELHTGSYANATTKEGVQREFGKIKESAKFGRSIGLQVFAGHGLNYLNAKMLTSIEEIEEYNIGHSIVARAVFVGLESAVREMKELVL